MSVKRQRAHYVKGSVGDRLRAYADRSGECWVGYYDDLAEAERAVIEKRNDLFTHNLLDRVA